MILRGAKISPCGRYRSHLSRIWDRERMRVLFVMLNPSTADEMVDDPTIRRCIAFARVGNFGGLTVVNLFQLRATDPKALLEPGEKNPANCDEVIADAMRNSSETVAAWGALHPRLVYRAHQVDTVAQQVGRSMLCLGTTKAGWPRHPLYLRNDQTLEQYRTPELAK